MEVIARDETRHGAFSWQIVEWLETKLSPNERARIRDARDAEVASLRRRVGARVSPHLVRIAGVPDADRANALAAQLARC
jgi:hypothetical protein